MASLPPFGPFLGKAMIEEAASRRRATAGWPSVFVVASALTGGGRAAGRGAGVLRLGIGTSEDAIDVELPAPGEEADPELDYPHERVPATMTVAAARAAGRRARVGLVPGLAADAVEAPRRAFVDRSAYAAPCSAAAPAGATAVRRCAVRRPGSRLAARQFDRGRRASALAWLALAAARGRRRRRLGAWPRAAGLRGLRTLHSGHVGDYVTWLVVGTALLGACSR